MIIIHAGIQPRVNRRKAIVGEVFPIYELWI